jgi:hypothetical protein
MQLLTHEDKAIRSVCTPDVTVHAPVRGYIATITPVVRQDAPTSLNLDPSIVLLTARRAAEARGTAILTVRPVKRNPLHITYMIMMMWKISMKIIMMTSIAMKIILMRHGIRRKNGITDHES